jgi:hypothetical protein
MEGEVMLIGKRFKLAKHGLGLERIEGQHNPMLIPAGATIEIISDPTYGVGLVNVIWETREVAMFLTQIDRLGQEIREEQRFEW